MTDATSAARIAGAELTKLRTLPGFVAVFAATVVATAVSAGGLSASSDSVSSAAAAVLSLVPFVQIGFILLGVLSFTHEYAGKQIYASLVAVPQRVGLAFTKLWVLGAVALGTALLSLGTALGAAALALSLRGDDATAGVTVAETPGEWWQLAGAACYLALVALLTQAIAFILRTLIPALVASLLLLVVLPPLLLQAPDAVKWLPDQAGSALYLADGAAAFRPLAGALVLLGWCALALAVALIRFAKRDPSDG